MKDSRVIRGKKFTLDTTWIAKWTADQRAALIRRKGKLARVIKIAGYGYTVWEAPHERQTRN